MKFIVIHVQKGRGLLIDKSIYYESKFNYRMPNFQYFFSNERPGAAWA